jgi:hypothetical protein
MRRIVSLVILLMALSTGVVHAQFEATQSSEASSAAEATASAMTEPFRSPSPEPRPDLTQSTAETIGPLEQVIAEQDLGSPGVTNFFRHAIVGAVDAGVAPNTIVLLLLLPMIATLIAASRHMLGLRGFGIFLPAALSVVFVAIGPLVGILFFLLIVFATTLTRMVLRKLRVKLQYLPKMAMLVWVVSVAVLIVLFLAPYYQYTNIGDISIFPLLILILLSESFSKVQTGKSARTAVAMATETIVVSLISYILLTTRSLHIIALTHPESLLLAVLIADILLGKYIGLRFFEYWRYRKLLNRK